MASPQVSPQPSPYPMQQVGVGSYELVPKTYKSLGWPDKTSSQGDPTPCASNSTSISGIRPAKTLLPESIPLTSTRHRSTSQRALRSHSSKTRTKARCRILFSQLDPHHTPKNHTKISLIVITLLSAPSALATHKQSSTRHHIIDIMRNRKRCRTRFFKEYQALTICVSKMSTRHI
jgi:hypothetical protein